jgi:dipeptidyl-peptidase 4
MHPTKNTFFWLSESNGYNHIYEIDYANNKAKAITKGNWDVESFEGYDPKTYKIYFTSNMQKEPQKQLYAIEENGNYIEKVTVADGWHNIWLSKDFNYFFDKATTINSPSVYKIYKTSGREITNKAIIENKRFKDNIKPYDVNDASFFTFKNKNEESINGWIISGDKDNNATKKRPLILYIYGGNNKQEATDEWDDRMAMTFRYFANKGYTVACIDPNGTPGRGEKFRKSTYNNLTKSVIDDIKSAKNYLQNNYNIDSNKTTIMGWSYGGYLATLFATKYAGTFTNTIAIAPVTNWRNYGAVYTERIIGSPSDNPELYKSLMPEEYVQNYKGGLLLVHGTADDNVHVQHSFKLAKALTESDAYYDVQIFTDKGHNLSDGAIDKTRMNLYRKIYKFLERSKSGF